MAFFDWPQSQLEAYLPARIEPADFDAFWAETLNEARQHPINARFEPFDAGLTTVEVYDVTFNGYAGQPIKGWLLLPRQRFDRLPCIVEYIGYGGGRGHPLEWLTWSSAGYAHFVMDTRGQGSFWRSGDTPDPEPDGTNPQHPGFMTRGILSPRTYYYRRVFTDAARAIDAVRSHAMIDPEQIILTGASQGGGITLAAAALAPDVRLVMPDVPFLCHYQEAVTLIDTDPYNEIVRFLKVHRDKSEAVFNTLSYFDGVNFAARAKARALFSVGLMDTICPPRTVYAAYNHYAGEKTMAVYTFNNHEGGGIEQQVEKMRFVRQALG